jgi:short-subunit dehydrogenase
VLDSVKAHLGAQHSVFALDITDTETTRRTAQAIKATFGTIDRVIFLAAAYTPMKIDMLDMAVTKKIIDINLTGAFNLIDAILPILKTQKSKGQLALCGSVAGYIGLPNAQPYSATKAAIINLAESLYAEYQQIIDIKLINPGFVSTPLTDKNDFVMPFIISPQKAAKAIANGLLSRSFEIHFPKKFTFFLKLLKLLPYALSLKLIKNIKRN